MYTIYPPVIRLDAMQLLVAMYNEPHRHYHNTTHIHAMLRELARAAHVSSIPARDMMRMVYMIWFHDAYYDPYAPPAFNEVMSATLFADWATSLPSEIGRDSRPQPAIDGIPEICDGIRASAFHTRDQKDLSPNIALFLDIDLHELGADVSIFDHNSKNILLEYSRTPHRDKLLGRASFFDAMLSREQLFYTRHMRDKYELSARKNMADDLDRINRLIQKGEL